MPGGRRNGDRVGRFPYRSGGPWDSERRAPWTFREELFSTQPTCPIGVISRFATDSANSADCPSSFTNDANAAAFGEFWVGSGREFDSLILLTLGTGVGGGIIVNGRAIEGLNSFGAECGHIIIDSRPDARLCVWGGGRGELEAYASAGAVVQRAQTLLDEGRSSTVTKRLADGKQLTTSDSGGRSRERGRVGVGGDSGNSHLSGDRHRDLGAYDRPRRRHPGWSHEFWRHSPPKWDANSWSGDGGISRAVRLPSWRRPRSTTPVSVVTPGTSVPPASRDPSFRARKSRGRSAFARDGVWHPAGRVAAAPLVPRHPPLMLPTGWHRASSP